MKELTIYKADTSKKKMVPIFEEGLYCGEPGDGQSVPDYVDVAEWITDGDSEVFLAVVHGQSMIDLGYAPGDMCLVSRERTAREGSIIVARIGSEFTMKVYHCDRENKRIVLYPANKDYEPIVVNPWDEDFEVWGVVTKCIKNCSADGLTIIRTYRNMEKRAREKKKTDFTDEEVRERIDAVMIDIKPKRKWFCIIKVLMWIHKVPEDDFRNGVDYINGMYPDAGLTDHDAHNFKSKLNVCSFSRPLEQWRRDDAPVGGTTYDQYYKLTERFKKSF